MQFRVFEPHIQVLGQAVYAVIDAFTILKYIPSNICLQEGIGISDAEGNVIIDPEAWYPQEAWLRVFEWIALNVGAQSLFKIGTRIPENAIFPPWVNDIESAIQAIDIAYHMNHRKQDKVMFNPHTGEMLEGIGHYGYHKVPHESKIISECNNPYPCEFDRGILTAMAKKLHRMVRVVHDDSKPCRNKGQNSCTYVIMW
ncbi:hypothetical protein ACFL27_09460 [candidate division CSSED10-310 bacterium]|uniref:4-vinyl reductase 4VR domain-containing protein n=1 Tax=candidate division CSSED10-310 bacterium TaxID=2855610 RepID=A0ABV6YW24_UNCC1